MKAQEFKQMFECQTRDDEGFYAKSPSEILKGFDHTVEYPMGRNSEDPSWDVTFCDGSKVHVGNPHQRIFYAFVI